MKRFKRSISRHSTGICIVLQMRDGDKLQTSGKKTGVDIIDIIAYKSLGQTVRERSDIDKLMVEALEGTKNEWRWSKAKLGANTPLAVSMTVCRAGAAVELADNRTDKFVMPVFSLNVINDESRAINRLACLEFISVPTGAGSLAEAMITVTEVYHTFEIRSSKGRTARRVQCY